jgi:hypothetical protein
VASFARFCSQGARFGASRRVLGGLLALLLAGCGVDAERRYASLSSAQVEVESGGFRARYLSPPWYSVPDDPLVAGERVQVPVGDTTRDIVPESALVLEIENQSALPDPMGLSYPKYRLEAALLHCTQDQIGAAESCAAALATQDLTGRSASEDTDFFGADPRPGKNDFGQAYWELLTRVPETGRYRRIQYLQTDDALTAARVFVEANPALDDEEMTRMLHAFELLSGSDSAENER